MRRFNPLYALPRNLRTDVAQRWTTPNTPPGLSGAVVGEFNMAGFALGFTAGGGGFTAPATPVVSGLTLAYRFPISAGAAGAFPATIASAGGSEATAVLAVSGGGPTIVDLGGGRLAVRTDGVDDAFQVTNGLAPFNAANNAPVTIALVMRMAANPAATAWPFFVSDTVITSATTQTLYGMFVNTSGGIVTRRANPANTNAVSTAIASFADNATKIVVLTLNPAAAANTQRLRVGTSLQSTTAIDVNHAAFDHVTFGASRVANALGNFAAVDIEDIIVWAGVTDDTGTLAIRDALAASYT
jgi:hypothetical protein